MRVTMAIAAAVVASLAWGSASAGTRCGVDAHGAWNRFAMGAINDSLSSFNREYGTTLRPIEDGGSWGLGFFLWPRPDVRVRLGYERLEARTADSRVEFDLGVQALTLGVAWFTPATRRLRFGGGAAVGPHLAQGGFHAPGVSMASSGNGFGGHVDAEVLAPLGRGLAVTGLLGYRLAGIGALELDGSSTDLRPSYDGWLVRLGMAYDLTP